MLQGGQCWAGRAVQQLLDVGILSAVDINHPANPLCRRRLHADVVREAVTTCNKHLWQQHNVDLRSRSPQPASKRIGTGQDALCFRIVVSPDDIRPADIPQYVGA